jgi:adenine-specific DNA-methyltransferase
MKNVKNKIGFVETPKEIAELMVDLASIDKNDPVLDTGCGKGIFLQALNDRGYKNVQGIEIDDELYNSCLCEAGSRALRRRGSSPYEFRERFTYKPGCPAGYFHHTHYALFIIWFSLSSMTAANLNLAGLSKVLYHAFHQSGIDISL